MSVSPKGSAYRVITTIVLLALLFVLAVILILRSFSATLFSGGNLPNDTFLSTSSDTVYVVPVNLPCLLFQSSTVRKRPCSTS